MDVLGHLEPKNVFRFFEELSRIPRGSGNEKAASDYIVQFARDRNLWVLQDESDNVIIRKPATPGYENAPGVIIQGHIDMVNEKNKETVHDFEKDPIKMIIDGDYIHADGTTLGADNAVAVAIGMAVVDSNDLKHPQIELLFTTGEEVGLLGAKAVDGSIFTGKMLLNLDCGPEGVFFVGCSGGMRQVISIPAEYTALKAGYETWALQVRGLNGGHSGALIDKELANSNKLMGRALCALQDVDYYLGEISGGAKENAIPREADAIVAVKKEDGAKAKAAIAELEAVLKSEYRKSEDQITLLFEKTDPKERFFTKEVTDKVVGALMMIPYGVLNKSLDIEGLTETSSNLGVVITQEDKIDIISSSRSSVGTRRTAMKQQFQYIAKYLGAEYTMLNEYPGWEYRPESPLRDLCAQTYKTMYGKDAEITATHGGLECGILLEKMPDVDAVAFGPDADGAHTPEERLSISSMKRVYEFVVMVLENIK